MMNPIKAWFKIRRWVVYRAEKSSAWRMRGKTRRQRDVRGFLNSLFFLILVILGIATFAGIVALIVVFTHFWGLLLFPVIIVSWVLWEAFK